MSKETEKKAEFIVAWYKKERGNFSFAKQVILAKTWIDICTKNEEYEMAAALQKEKDNVVAEYLKEKRANRTWKEKVKYFCIKLMRKIKNLKK